MGDPRQLPLLPLEVDPHCKVNKQLLLYLPHPGEEGGGGGGGGGQGKEGRIGREREMECSVIQLCVHRKATQL